MSGNISSPRIRLTFSKYDVALFIDEKGDTRWKHLIKEFVENESERHISRQKLSDYLKELCNEGLITKTIDKKALMLRLVWRIYPIYVVPKSRKKRIEEIRQRKKLYEFVDSASQEDLKKLDEAIGLV
jgi:predicted house-cleaning noncanonical NTP pyrophosphatase (MazG superfamily)